MKLLQGVSSLNNLVDVVRLVSMVKKMQMPEIVKPEQPAPAELRDRVLERVRAVTRQHCEKYQQLKSVGDYRLNEQQLKATRKAVADLELPELTSMVDIALSTLDGAKTAIENKQQDENAIAILRSIEGKGALTKLNELIARIKGMSLVSALPKQLAEEKMNALAAEVERLVSLATGIPARLSAVRDLRSLDEVQSDKRLFSQRDMIAHRIGEPCSRSISSGLRTSWKLSLGFENKASQEEKCYRMSSG
jgi:hypothetical protein